MGDKHKKTPAAVCIRWQVQRGLTVVPKSCNPGRMAANLDNFGFELSDDEMQAIQRPGRLLQRHGPARDRLPDLRINAPPPPTALMRAYQFRRCWASTHLQLSCLVRIQRAKACP